jgi:fatty acid desaturase
MKLPLSDTIDERITSSEFDPSGSAKELDAAVRRPKDLLSRAQIASFAERSDAYGLAYLGAHIALIVLGAYLLVVTGDSYWAIPIFAIHAVVIGFLFSALHECAHATAFKSRWLNDSALWVVALLYIVPPYFFRYFHLGHHRYTQVPGKDPSLVLPEPSGVWQYIWYCAALWFWWRNISWLARHTCGAMSPASNLYVPKAKRSLLVYEARIMVAVYACVLAGGWVSGTLGWILILWIAPRVLGEPVQRMIRVAEHVGCEESENLLANTRTTLTNGLINALAWQMPYHAEHHLYPNVPFFRLPKVHRHVAQKIVVEPRGYWVGQWHILATLKDRAGVGRLGGNASL